MKNPLKLLLSGLLTLYFLCVVLFTMSPMRLLDGDGGWFSPPCDISYALAECECLRKGVDPYDVWSGKVVLEGYRPGMMSPPSERIFAKTDAPVNVHPPWFYTVMLPFTFLTHRMATAVHFMIMIICFAVFLLVGRNVMKTGGCPEDKCCIFPMAAVLMIALPAFQDFHSENWAVMTLAAALLMACCLNRGHDVLAGFCWSFLMIKPQVGLIFAVPVLMGRKFVTLFVAVAGCLIASVVPSVLSGSSVLKMIFVTPCSNYTQFWGCGTMPKVIADLLPQPVAIYLGLGVGAAVCALMTGRMLKEKNWFLILMPAAVCSSLWSYSRCYGHVMGWFFFMILFLDMVKAPRSRFLWILFACSMVLFPRFNNFLHILFQMSGEKYIPPVLLSDTLHYHVDSIVSLLSLIVMIVFCFGRNGSPDNKLSNCR